ncbi:VOC family protein [Albimonas pacifica]|uniref:Glyoxalase/Bleomycin resistance protein/Dioxygenase superfamily protein n=1 Tax=Albimonas pacifica TaxID=1114924 RepID=A0A1I3MN25_9RHOB|nr:VOC family protein [Albimonas pacifica]SFI98383.1 Glyoxalase/Bleomycin resistance protein/Dioxygenase superfamily protein [Albimonas pacifica]
MTGIVTAIDHLVLTVRDIEAAVDFYARALGVEAVTFGAGRRALQIGDQKINLQTLGMELRNYAGIGSGDLCLLTELPLADVVARLTGEGTAIVEGPVQKTGARGPFMSVYFNDPDGNLIEVSNYAEAP